MITQVSPADFSQWLAQQSTPPLVLDVREPWELQTASVKPEGFELLHMPMQSIPQRLPELPQDRPIACLCHHGVRSLQVAYFLHQQGFEQLANITGGIEAWSQQRDASVPLY
jgi:rhodanese-related sulfurtransferase